MKMRLKLGETPTFRDAIIAIPVSCFIFALLMSMPAPEDDVTSVLELFGISHSAPSTINTWHNDNVGADAHVMRSVTDTTGVTR
jgi:hypothetical protein